MPFTRRTTAALLFAATLLAAMTTALAATDEVSNGPAAERLAELTALMKDATPERVATYITGNYTEEYASYLPLERRIGGFMDWRRRGGMDIVDVLQSAPERIEAIVRHPVTEERMVISVDVEASTPHRIQRIRLRPAPPGDSDAALDDAAIAERWLAYVDRLADHGLFSGAVLIARNGVVLGQRARGIANRDFDISNTTDTRFNLGSLNKTWTAVAIAQLVEAGKLALDDPLSKFIDYPDAESAAKIRIEHLLTHTSGLGSYFTETYDRTARKHLRSLDDYLALSADEAPAFEPGTDWRYSNTGMLVLGRVIEVVSGQDYYDYIQQHVLDRAGMRASGCLELDRVNENLAVGYAERWSLDGVEIVNNLFDHVVRGGPAGGCYATTGDLFRFATALNDGTLVSPSMAETLTTPRPDLGSPDYALGFGVGPGRSWYGHSGGFIGIGANLDISTDPAGWVVVVLTNDESMPAAMMKARQLIGLREGD